MIPRAHYSQAAAGERGEISLFIGEGPFHKVQSFIIWADGVGGMQCVLCVCWGLGALQLKTHHDLVTGGSYKGQNLNREKRHEEREAELQQSSASDINSFHTFSHPDVSIRVSLEQQHEINILDN